jgi:hypothetical protein
VDVLFEKSLDTLRNSGVPNTPRTNNPPQDVPIKLKGQPIPVESPKSPGFKQTTLTDTFIKGTSKDMQSPVKSTAKKSKTAVKEKVKLLMNSAEKVDITRELPSMFLRCCD